MADKKYQVVVSRRAAQMMVAYADFLSGVSIEAAERLTNEFQKTANSLAEMPHRGRWLVGEFIPRNKYRRLVIDKRYLLIYQVVDDTVYVDYLIDGRQDYQWLLYEP